VPCWLLKARGILFPFLFSCFVLWCEGFPKWRRRVGDYARPLTCFRRKAREMRRAESKMPELEIRDGYSWGRFKKVSF